MQQTGAMRGVYAAGVGDVPLFRLKGGGGALGSLSIVT